MGFGGLNHKLNLMNNVIKIEFIPPLDVLVAFHKVTNNDILPSKDPWKLELYGKMEDKGEFQTIFVNFETALKQIEIFN